MTPLKKMFVLGVMCASAYFVESAANANPLPDCRFTGNVTPGYTTCPTDFCPGNDRCIAEIHLDSYNYECCNGGTQKTWTVQTKSCSWRPSDPERPCNEAGGSCETWSGYIAAGGCTTFEGY